MIAVCYTYLKGKNLSDALIYFNYFVKEKTWSTETVIKVPSKKVEGWALPEMPGE